MQAIYAVSFLKKVSLNAEPLPLPEVIEKDMEEFNSDDCIEIIIPENITEDKVDCYITTTEKCISGNTSGLIWRRAVATASFPDKSTFLGIALHLHL